MKVGIQNKDGRLILVWNDGKRRTMAIGMPDTPPVKALAEKTKAKIEWDWHIKQYDPTLLKYRPRTVAKALGHSARVLHDSYAEIIESRSVINTVELIQGIGSEGGDRE
jgi:hypothetical protein